MNTVTTFRTQNNVFAHVILSSHWNLRGANVEISSDPLALAFLSLVDNSFPERLIDQRLV
ncbi:MAG: hypothetical protein ACI9R3_005529 [Verrucomicrobiales bacterium]|jgi:hypothetical protein